MRPFPKTLPWVLILVPAAIGGIMLAFTLFSPLGLFNALVPKESGVVVEPDIAFGPHPRHRLDIYRPKSGSDLPVIVFIYGGGWESGEKAEYGFIGHALAARGFITVIADYRLVPEVVYPDFVADNALALSFVQNEIARFGGDPARLFLMGQSAGAYNAAMLALDPRFGIAPSALSGVIGLSGPYDFYPFDAPASQNAFGAYPDPQDTQPVNHVSAHAPPMLLVHGDRDTTVHLRNTLTLAGRLEAAGARAEVKVYDGAAHADTLLSLSRPLRWRYRVLEDVLDFLIRHGEARAP